MRKIHLITIRTHFHICQLKLHRIIALPKNTAVTTLPKISVRKEYMYQNEINTRPELNWISSGITLKRYHVFQWSFISSPVRFYSAKVSIEFWQSFLVASSSGRVATGGDVNVRL